MLCCLPLDRLIPVSHLLKRIFDLQQFEAKREAKRKEDEVAKLRHDEFLALKESEGEKREEFHFLAPTM